jgi:MFS family permease
VRHSAPVRASAPARTARALGRRVRAATRADGADRSGLAALLEAHALHSAGDALVTVALAGSVFFSVPLGQARGRVALYLLLTLLPFSLLVPVAGPLLDRFPHGRRNVLALTAGARGLVAWSMATQMASLALYPLALAVLVLSRAFGVARSAAVGRVRPPQVSLVAANARLNVAAVAAASVAAAIGAGISRLVGSSWTLRLAAVVLLCAAVSAIRLPAHVDESRREKGTAAPAYRLLSTPPAVRRPLIAALALRGLAGMVTVFLAFLLRSEGASGRVIAVVLGAAVLGQLLGTIAASRLPDRVVRRLTLGSLAVPAAACVLAAVTGGPGAAALAAGLTGLAGSLAKFALDAALQTHVPPASTGGAFARSETGLQLSWALGGGVAVALPAVAALGFAVAAAFPVAGLVVTARALRGPAARPRTARTP